MSSAIFATIHRNGEPVDRARLHAATQIVQRRYPDGTNHWVDGAVGLAQAQLATLPEDKPGVVQQRGECTIVASCRIDNRTELRSALATSWLTEDACDAEYILAAYLAWGEQCLDRLIGDFAFVIWDARQKLLFAARDLSGTLPFYYFWDERRLVIATELVQLLQDPSIALEVDEAQIVEYFTPAFQWSSGWNLGMFCHVRAFPAGHRLIVTEDQFHLQPYWQWRTQAIDHRSEADLYEEYIDLLQQAVRARLRTVGPVAMELSGGLDSTALVSLAAQMPEAQVPEAQVPEAQVPEAQVPEAKRGELHTISMVFPEIPETDERGRIEALLAYLPADRVTAHFVEASARFAPECMAAGWQPDLIVEPHQLQLTAAHRAVTEAAAAVGCRVILTGEMGDTVNGGIPFVHYDLWRRGYWQESLRRLRIEWQWGRKRTLFNLYEHGLLPMMPMPFLQSALRRSAQAAEAADLPVYLSPQLRRQVIERDRALRVEKAIAWEVRSPAIRSLLSESTPPMPFLGTPRAVPVEHRHPYTDRRLLEFMLRFPPELKWEHERYHFVQASRRHHRLAMRDHLPAAIWEKNIGVYFDPAIAHTAQPQRLVDWFQAHETIHLIERGYVNPDRFLAELAQDQAVSGYSLTMLCLEAWLRGFEQDGALQQIALR